MCHEKEKGMTCEQCVVGLEFVCTSIAEVDFDVGVDFGFVRVEKVSPFRVLSGVKFEFF